LEEKEREKERKRKREREKERKKERKKRENERRERRRRKKEETLLKRMQVEWYFVGQVWHVTQNVLSVSPIFAHSLFFPNESEATEHNSVFPVPLKEEQSTSPSFY